MIREEGSYSQRGTALPTAFYSFVSVERKNPDRNERSWAVAKMDGSALIKTNRLWAMQETSTK
jgi:hypothetical protein